MPDDRSRTQVLRSSGQGPAPDNAVLVVIGGPNLGRHYPLSSPEYVIGRIPEAHIQIDADSVSRRHARVVRDGRDWVVEDLGSTNGTFVNAHKVERAHLRDGDLIVVGGGILKFLTGSNVEALYHEEIYRMTILDPLTGLHNKRFFLEFLDRELSRVSRHSGTLALVLFDVDHFKRVNDQYGHLAGDAVLREIGKRVRPRVRREDLVARYGGEEFACVLPDTTRQGAHIFADAVRIIIERESFRAEGAVIAVTVSLGVAVAEGAARVSAEELIRRADERLYEAKRAGRNRVAG
ncbi:MAG TPA: GGDEF domain-containing protein [Haliangiales bacterium]|nr:GGDEF domain-containing protein [Haliangiales bacterium]